MDTDLAQAVFQRWEEGLPVFEGTLYKAAEALGVNPGAALLEARYYTQLDRGLVKLAQGRQLSPVEAGWLVMAAGSGVVKVAEAHGLDPVELALQALEARNWQPDFREFEVEKLAFVMSGQGQATEASPQDGGLGSPVPGGVDPAAGDLGPQPGQQVQQQPAARQGPTKFRPTPTAPLQVPPMPGGNIDQILQEAQQAQGGQQGQPGGMDPATGQMSGAPADPGAEPPPQPSPQDKLLQVAPNLDPQVVDRYAEALQQLEQQVGQAVQDPKQLQKFIQQMQKADGKRIDEAIKQMAETQQQQMMSPTLGAPKGLGAAQPGQQAGAPQGQQQLQGAMQKVAGAAAVLARCRLTHG